MCPPPDSAARDGAPAGSPTARVRVPPPPEVGPRPDSVVAATPAKPPVVTPPDPATLVATPDRTVVTRRPRASHRPSEPHELMPTLRMPPVEARALRRQVSGSPDADADAVALGSGEIEIEIEPRPNEPDAAPTTPPAEVATVEDTRDRQATVRVVSIPIEGTTVGMPPRPPARLHRPPLPLPDVLRNGPRTAPRSVRAAAPIIEVAAAMPAVPASIPMIDTASLVLEMTESLIALPTPEPDADAPIEDDARDDAREPDVAVLSLHLPVAAPPTAAATETPVTTIEDEKEAAPRRRGLFAMAIGVAASIAAAMWWLAPPTQGAERVDDAFAPLGDQLAFVAESTLEPEPRAQVVVPAAAPSLVSLVSSNVAPATELLGAAAGDLIADAMLPQFGDVPDEVAAEAATEVDNAPVAAPTPVAKSKPSPHRAKSPSEPKVSAPAPPPPGAKTSTASLDPAALLREAEKAYAEGRYGTALRNAQRSLAGRNDARSTRIVALSACKLKRESVAKSALERLPFGQRRGVRNTCKDAGIKV